MIIWHILRNELTVNVGMTKCWYDIVLVFYVNVHVGMEKFNILNNCSELFKINFISIS